MYGRGGGLVSGASGAATTVAGIAVLPNTGGNSALAVLAIATIVVGSLVMASFVFTRLFARYNR